MLLVILAGIAGFFYVGNFIFKRSQPVIFQGNCAKGSGFLEEFSFFLFPWVLVVRLLLKVF